ncbi:MAG: septum formation initiator family protein [Bacilli bacterium]|nr:septum formation initiator family protein [Bacilli bacterium]
MKKKKKKNSFLSSLEKGMYRFCIVIIILLIVGIVCGQTTLAQINLEVQKLNKAVNDQRNKNESLEMKIDEMTSLDRIKEVSAQYGLSYNSDNIKTIK